MFCSCTEVFTQWSEKAACVYEMHIAGLDMRVMPGAFLLHVGIKGPATRTGKVSHTRQMCRPPLKSRLSYSKNGPKARPKT